MLENAKYLNFYNYCNKMCWSVYIHYIKEKKITHLAVEFVLAINTYYYQSNIIIYLFI